MGQRTAILQIRRRKAAVVIALCAATVFITWLARRKGEAQLRIYNESSVALQQLTVLFPEDRVEMGDVGAGATTSYREVPHGVGEHASFSFVLNDIPIRQYVADFVGWKPIRGRAFTYHVRVERGRSQPFLNVTAVVISPRNSL